MLISKEKCFLLIKNLTKEEALDKLTDLKEELSDRLEYEFDDSLNSLMIDILEEKVEMLFTMINNAIFEDGIIVGYTDS